MKIINKMDWENIKKQMHDITYSLKGDHRFRTLDIRNMLWNVISVIIDKER